ncbi:hypothetical protein QBC35DRAFT_12176 [Podospora australis]|uniref:Uncharacterized protein n=1 Tax=Podospora australis TaxID=1536484 RepID=A0AAN6WZR5_9PEZI|nr:hypothetical protein QBC35DRAFT_12176 [Podospora australis]
MISVRFPVQGGSTHIACERYIHSSAGDKGTRTPLSYFVKVEVTLGLRYVPLYPTSSKKVRTGATLATSQNGAKPVSEEVPIRPSGWRRWTTWVSEWAKTPRKAWCVLAECCCISSVCVDLCGAWYYLWQRCLPREEGEDGRYPTQEELPTSETCPKAYEQAGGNETETLDKTRREIMAVGILADKTRPDHHYHQIHHAV